MVGGDGRIGQEQEVGVCIGESLICVLTVLTMKLGAGLMLISSTHTPIAAEYTFTYRAQTSPK